MKKTFLILAALIVTVSVYGQKDRNYLGAGINYRGDIQAFGINVKYGVRVIGNLYLEPNFNYFFKDDRTFWDINLDAKYNIRIGSRLRVYPLVGLIYSQNEWEVHIDCFDTPGCDRYKTYDKKKWGASFGGGASYDILGRLYVNIDLRYRGVKHARHGLFGAGLGYRF